MVLRLRTMDFRSSCDISLRVLTKERVSFETGLAILRSLMMLVLELGSDHGQCFLVSQLGMQVRRLSTLAKRIKDL